MRISPIRFTIRGIMELVAIMALALTLYRLTPAFCVAIIAALVLAALGAAVLGVRFQRGRVRAFCVGFAFSGGAYFLWFVSPTIARNTADPGRRIAQSLITVPIAAAGGSAASLGHGLSARLMTGRGQHPLDERNPSPPHIIPPPE